MATIVVVPSDVSSKRMLAERLGERLAGAGHRVIWMPTVGPDGAPDDRPRDHDVRPVTIRPPAGVRHRMRPVAQWRAVRAAAAAIDPARLGTALDEVGADLAIVDIEEYEAVIAALALPRRPPLAVLCSFFEPWPIAGLGPNDPGPPGGPLARLRGRTAWWRLWARMRAYGLRQHLLGAGTDRIAVSRALARRLGVRRHLTSRQWLHPFAPVGLPMLVCNALELDVPHRPRPGVRHIGSLLAPPPAGPSADRALAGALRAADAAGRPVVFCGFGAVMAGRPAPLVDRIGEVARLRPGYEFVVGTGDDAQRRSLGELPNVHAAAWLPQRAVLAQAAAAIVHSGNATLHECVAARVPMVVYPFAVNDQPRNAARVARHGIGEVGDRERDDAATIAARLDRVLNDPGIRRRLEELAVPVVRYEHEGVAVAEVEALLRTSGHVTGAGRTPPSS